MSFSRSLGFCLLCLLLPLGNFASGQTSVEDKNLNTWFNYFGDHPVSQRWSVHLETQVRRARGVLTWQQLLLRPGVNFAINKHVILTGGYTFIYTWPYGDFPRPFKVPENALFEQIVFKHKLGRVGIQHRLREEQRFIGQYDAAKADIDGWQSRHRFRYFLRADIPLGNGPGNRFGLAFYNEFFVQFGANRGANHLDQNRAYGALTYKLSKNNRFEAGYMYQYIPLRNGFINESNHNLQFVLFSTSPFRHIR